MVPRVSPTLLLLVLFVLPALGQERDETAATHSDGTHVILTNIAEDGAYAGAVLAYREDVHPEATVLRFAGRDPTVVAVELADLEPRFVTVVVAPGDLDINFQSRMLRLCTALDEDPFCDFSFGYVTGATPAEAAQFVANIARARKTQRPPQVLSVPKVGASESSRSTETATQFGVDWPLVRLTFGEVDGRDLNPEEIRARLAAHVEDFAGNRVIMMGGHGSPTGIGGSLSGADLRAVQPDLFPAVVYNYACMTGTVSTCWQWYERGDDFNRVQPRRVAADESMCLAILASGAPAYISSLEPRPAGPGMSAECLYALRTGATVGEARRREYDLLVLGFLARDEDGIVLPSYEAGQARVRRDAVRDIMMMDASGAVLFGDPSFRVGERQGGLFANELSPRSSAVGWELTCKLEFSSYSIGFDPYRSWPGGRRLASQLHSVVELPPELQEVERVAVHSVKAPDGRRLEHAYLTWAIEHEGDRRLLHVKVNCPPGEIREAGTVATFLVNGEPGEGEAPAASETTTRDQGGLQKVLDGSWHLVRKEWQLGAFLDFIQSFLENNGERYGLDTVTFAFAEDVADRRDRKIVVEAVNRESLATILKDVCDQTGLAFRADHETRTVTLVAGER